MKITLLGGGLGSPDTLTLGAWKALQNAQVLVGARRVLESLPKELTGEQYPEIAPQKIVSRLKQAMEEGKTEACVVLSGDVGFYSGARKLLPLLDFGSVEVLPGLSSPQYLASRLGMPWQDYHLVSAHGLGEDQVDPVGEVRCYPETFFLTGGQFTPQSICCRLTQEGLGHLMVTVGENLSYPEETITRGRAEELAEQEFESLSVMLVENPRPAPLCLTGGLPDDCFLRGKAPMTKQEVRAVSLAFLSPGERDTLWDVGAGTGSVSVELARLARKGRVYAVECGEEAFSLLEENKRRFALRNLFPVQGMAPEALEALPAPQGVFIGGSKGNLGAILQVARKKNPHVRVVINAIALETVHQALDELTNQGFTNIRISQVAVSRGKEVGRYHMMTALNPVYVLGGEGSGL